MSLSENLSAALKRRVLQYVNAHRNQLEKHWRQTISNCDLDTSHILEMLDEGIGQSEDLLSIFIRTISEGHSEQPQQAAKNILLNKVRSKEYSISDFFLEICCFEASLQDVMKEAGDFTDREILDYSRYTQAVLQKIFNQVLLETSEVYEYVTERGRSGFCQLDNNGCITFANHELKRMIGTEPASAQHLLDFIDPQDRKYVEDATKEWQPGKAGVREITLVDVNGTAIPVLAEIQPLNIGVDHIGAYALLTDISPIIERQINVFNKSPLGIVRANSDLKLCYVNPSAEEIIGTKDWKNRSIKDFVTDEHSKAVLEQQVSKRTGGEIGDYEITITRLSDKTKIPVRIAGIPVMDTNGRTLGSMGIIRNLETDAVKKDIHEIIENLELEEGLLEQVVKRLEPVLPFDLFVVSRYSDDLQFASPFFTYSREKGNTEWKKRWYKLSEPVMRWTLESENIFASNDLEGFMARPIYDELRREPEVQQLLQAGYKSFIRLLVYKEGKLAASIAFISKVQNAYSDFHKDLLLNLPLAKSVLMALFYSEKQNLEFRFDLIKQIVNCSSIREIARTLVDGLSKYYKWTHLSFFKVSRKSNQIILLDQNTRGEQKIRLCDGYRQPMDQGLLGHVVKTKQYVNVGDVDADEQYRDIYIVGTKDTKSEACHPIVIDGSVQWILNIEDEKINAFSEQECKDLAVIVEEIGTLISRLTEKYFLEACFESTSDAVIITDNNHNIIRSNDASKSLLGYKRNEKLQAAMSDFVPDDNLGKTILQSKSFPSTEILLHKKGDESDVPVLLSGCELPDELSGKIYLAKDLSQKKRLEELEILGELFYEIAMQIQTPLALVFNWLKVIKKSLDESNLSRELIEKVTQQLRKVQLTYDRLAHYDTEKHLVPTLKLKLDLANELKKVLEDLPAYEKQRVNIQADNTLSAISADPYQISFIFQTVLSYFMRFHPAEEKIQVNVTQNDDKVTASLVGRLPTDSELALNPDSFVAKARAEMALGSSIINQFVKNHGGEYYERYERDGTKEIKFELPVS